MTAYRTGYGTGAYGVRLYSLDGEIFDATATVSAAAVVQTSAQRVYEVSAEATPQSGATASVERIFAGSAVVAAHAIVAPNLLLKWEPNSPQSEIWAHQAAAADIWTPVTASSETWTRAA